MELFSTNSKYYDKEKDRFDFTLLVRDALAYLSKNGFIIRDVDVSEYPKTGGRRYAITEKEHTDRPEIYMDYMTLVDLAKIKGFEHSD